MRIQLNGEDREVPAGTTVAQLLEQLDLGARRIAVELNESLVPRSRFHEQLLQEHDRMEIIQAVGGG